ncbi:MAG: hypothetical protein IPJ41_18460 [Phycisphaerales bacterium]|nr:hypothetical protein [Phycisphaerales bacterium]
MPGAETSLVHYIPILTTLLSGAFVVMLLIRASTRNWPPHLMWWAFGMACYGLGTAIESAITLHGNTPELNRWWYWAGAILGGYPLATGSLYLIAKRRTAHILTAISLAFVIFATVAVFLTPINAGLIDPAKPSGAVLEWHWVRLLTPFINTYAAIFLIGGAMYSAVRFLRVGGAALRRRAAGTIWIAVGALLPGIGGSMAKAGIVEALYIGEFFGAILILIGYQMCITKSKRREPGIGALASA